MDEALNRSCFCAEVLERYRTSIGNPTMADEKVLATCQEVFHSEEPFETSYRCQVCGQEWKQAVFDSGHVSFVYLSPST